MKKTVEEKGAVHFDGMGTMKMCFFTNKQIYTVKR